MKPGAHEFKGFRRDILPEVMYDLQNILCSEPHDTEIENSPANLLVFARDAIS